MAGADGPLWRPSAERLASANLTRFRERVAVRALASGLSAGATAPGAGGIVSDLHAWSVGEPAEFWAEVWGFCRVVASSQPTRIVDDVSKMPGARWFEGTRLNFAENLLAQRDGARRTEAIVACNELGRVAGIGWDDLRKRVAAFATALEQRGIGPGDAVAGFLPNIPEAVVAMLGTSTVGATWSSCSPDFGTEGVVDRFGQIAPVVLVCARGARWEGEWRDSVGRAKAIAARLPSVATVVVAEYGSEARGADTSAIPGAVAWEDFLAGAHTSTSDDRSRDGATPLFRQLPFDHPLYVLYTSGTTGPPKCIVHGQGGTLVQHLKELVLHCDLRAGDALCYYTTCGWMMWNWMVSALAAGATIVLYDGSPFHDGPARMWELVADERVTHFGTSAKYLALAEKRGLRPAGGSDLSSLRSILSTGSPLLPTSFDWVYDHVKRDLHLASISGGTDLVSCFVLGDPTAPVHRGEIQGPGLGMRVEVWGEDGRELPPHRRGELVCTRAFPSMPVGFWNDPQGRLYRATYFERFGEGVWRHGDWIERTRYGGFVIHGRSDATLNPSGVRIGTAEIYRQVERLEEVVESVAVGQEWKGSERIVLFVVLQPGAELDDALRGRIRDVIREGATPRHVPAVIASVPDLPRTVSGKVSEIAVRRAIDGLPVENAHALANPEALAHFANVRRDDP